MSFGAPVSLSVASASSEQPEHRVGNVLSSDHQTQWLAEAGRISARIELALDMPSPISAIMLGNAGSLSFAIHASCSGAPCERSWIGVPPRAGRAERGDTVCLLPKQPMPGARSLLVLKPGYGPGKLNSVACKQEWTHLAIDVYGDATHTPGLHSCAVLRPELASEAQHAASARRSTEGQAEEAGPQRAAARVILPATAAAAAATAAAVPPPHASPGPQPSPAAPPPGAGARRQTTPVAAPCCSKHGEPATRAYIKKAGKHFGRPIWCCKRGCGFVAWADQPSRPAAVTPAAAESTAAAEAGAAAALAAEPAGEELSTPPVAPVAPPAAAAPARGGTSDGSPLTALVGPHGRPPNKRRRDGGGGEMRHGGSRLRHEGSLPRETGESSSSAGDAAEADRERGSPSASTGREAAASDPPELTASPTPTAPPPAIRAPAPCLVVLRSGEEVELRADGFVIGRESQSTDRSLAIDYAIDCLAHPSMVSREHVRITRRDDGGPGGAFSGVWYVEDLGSRNGSSLDGRRFEAADGPQRMADGATLCLGRLRGARASDVLLRFDEHGAARAGSVEK